MLKLRRTRLGEINQVMKIINQAKTYFKENGIDQWQNGYPNPSVIENDINNNYSHVLLKNNEIVATVAISFDGEITYNEIFEGSWKSNKDYAVIHRIAIDSNLKGQGLSSEIINHTASLAKEKGVTSIKIDTHEDNEPMRRSLIKNGFDYCGIIYLTDGNPRVAYEKLLD